MARPRFDARALERAGLSKDQVRLIESLLRSINTMSETSDAELALSYATASARAGALARRDGELDPVVWSLLGRIGGLASRVATLESAPPGGGSATWTEVEVDFGSLPVYDASFTVADAGVSATSEVAVVQSGNAATGRADGDAQFDSIAYAAQPAVGQFTLYALAHPGPVVGRRKLLYQVA